MAPLTDLDLLVLELAAQRWLHRGSQEQAVKNRTGMSPTRYAQHLRWLLDSPAALEHDPVLVRRLQRLQDAGRRRRAA